MSTEDINGCSVAIPQNLPPRQVGTAQNSLFDRRTVNQCVGEVGIGEVCLLESRSREIRAVQKCTDQLRPAQVRFPKIGHQQIGSTQISLTQVGFAQVCVDQLGGAEICRTEVGTKEIRAGEICSAQISTVEARPVEIRITEVCLLQVSALQHCTAQVAFRAFVSRYQLIQPGIQGIGFHPPVAFYATGPEMDCEPDPSTRDGTREPLGCAGFGFRRGKCCRPGRNGMTRQPHGNKEEGSEEKRTRSCVAHGVWRLPGERRRVVAKKTLLQQKMSRGCGPEVLLGLAYHVVYSGLDLFVTECGVTALTRHHPGSALEAVDGIGIHGLVSGRDSCSPG